MTARPQPDPGQPAARVMITCEPVLTVFYRSTRLRAAVLTEVNPSYEPSGKALMRYVDTVTSALTAGLTAPG
jgi:hypothetical protein